MSNPRNTFYKPGLSLLMVGLLVLVSFMQRGLNKDRELLGLTRLTPLKNAPPVLAFTTVALGGFRGLIANVLWIRASDLQEEGKYFEMVQLADWITKLQPHITTVWYHQAWNMTYNISIKFQDPHDRWLWVNRGIELLRDEGLQYNPKETLLYRELAWFFQHKMGHNLDDQHIYYKSVWAEEMTRLFGAARPDFDGLINPQTEDMKQRAQLLRDKYKMDPRKMKEVDEQYGPLEWRLPEAHAIYWAKLGLENSKPEELMTLRRVIYQCMQLSFQRGRLIHNRFNDTYEFGPNLDIIPKVNAAYEEQIKADAEMANHMATGHRNFLKDAVYFLYTYNRLSDAAYWMNYVKEKYPNAIPDGKTLDEYAVERVTEMAGETSMDKTKAILEGLITSAFYNLAIGEDARAEALDRLATAVYAFYEQKVAFSQQRVGQADLGQIKQQILETLLDPNTGADPLMTAQLRTKLGLPAPTNQPPASVTAPTNNVPLYLQPNQ